jgi:NhaA family Na+:H+ antiporter
MRALRERLGDGVGAAALLLLATILALVWANAPFGDTYEAFWGTEVRIGIGDAGLSLTLQHWVNDGLMTFFFYIVGLEVKHELALGELADPRRAAVPALAALVGLAVPALVFVAFNLSDGQPGAWGVVISTDTAFVVGILALLGSAVPTQLRVFLLALAIGDDVGALLVIAVVYTEDVDLVALAVAVLGLLLMVALQRLRVWRGPAYLVIAAVAWVGLYLSGVHPTLLGVAIALVTPAYLPRRRDVEDAARRTRAYAQSPNAQYARSARLSIERSVPPGPRLQELWGPWVSFLFVPLFALANAGVPLTAETLGASLTSPITLGVVVALVLGKLIGISLGTGLAVKLRLGILAPGISRSHIIGGAALSGIGFTISLFIADLAFSDDQIADQAKVGVLAASVIAGCLGCTLLWMASRRHPTESGPQVLDPPVDEERDHIRGPVDAPLTLVGFGDFESPYSGWGSIDALHERFGDDFRYVFRHAPLDPAHQHAELAAEAAEAAAAQGRFWEMHDRLYTHPARLTPSELVGHAEALGLDGQRVARDLGSERFARHVRHDAESARASGATQMPAFFIGGRLHTGPHDAETLAAALIAETGRSAAEAGCGPGRAGARARAASPASAPPDDARHAHGWTPSQTLDDLPADLPETPDSGGDQPRLSDAQLRHLERYGARRDVARGDVLYRPGDPGYDFHVVLSGTVAIIARTPRGEPILRVHGARRFLGALDLFDRTTVQRAAIVIDDGAVLRLSVDQLREALDADHALRDLVQRAFLVRHAVGAEHSADLRIVGRSSSPRTRRLREWADAHGQSSVLIDIDSDDDAADAYMVRLCLEEADLPVVVLPRGHSVLRDPDDAQLHDALGLPGAP